MAIEIGICASVDELAGAFTPISHYFGGPPSAEEAERFARIFDYRRTWRAKENGAVVGAAGSHAFELTVPGGAVPAAGVTIVGVLPTHRRRGILRSMMRAQLDRVHEEAEPVAFLWASEETIYGRFGYGIASYCGEIELPKSATGFVTSFEPRGRARLLDEASALEPISALYERVRLDYPGMYTRSEAWWKERRLADPENRRHGGGVLNRVVLSVEGRVEAYALYRVHQAFEPGGTSGHINVIEAVGATPEATREIWRFLFDVDWVARIKASLLPVDHPLLTLVARTRQLKFRIGDALWVRLVDLPRALAARAWGKGEPVVFEVSDDFGPWNAGRDRVSSDGVERTTAAAEIGLSVNALGSAYLGGVSFSRMARAGAVEEMREGAARRADALFRFDPAPWCPEIF